MINKVDEAVETLKNKILSLPETREFQTLENLIEKDKLLKGMRIEIAKLNSEGKVKLRDAILEEYNAIPLVSNYNFVKEELFAILNEVSKILK